MGSRETRQKARIAALANRLDAAPRRVGQSWVALELMMPDGYSSGGGEQVSGGGVGRPVEAAIVAREGMSESRLQTKVERDHESGEFVEVEVLHTRGMLEVDEALRDMERALGRLEAACTQMVAPLVAKDPPARTNVEPCRACDRTVANTPGDRIKRGYCRACYEQWRREGQPDRFQFERRRLREAVAGDHSKQVVRDREAFGVDVWTAEAQVTLEGDLAARYRALEREHGRVPAEELAGLVAAARELAAGRIVTSLAESARLLGGGS